MKWALKAWLDIKLIVAYCIVIRANHHGFKLTWTPWLYLNCDDSNFQNLQHQFPWFPSPGSVFLTRVHEKVLEPPPEVDHHSGVWALLLSGVAPSATAIWAPLLRPRSHKGLHFSHLCPENPCSGSLWWAAPLDHIKHINHIAHRFPWQPRTGEVDESDLEICRLSSWNLLTFESWSCNLKK